MPPKKKSTIVKKDSPESQVLEYLEKQYRPYSANDIFQNLLGAIGKTAVTKALETLTEQGKIQTKTFGKMNVSVANQIVIKDDSENENLNYKELLTNLKNELEITNKEIFELQKELAEISQHADDKTVEKEFKILKDEVDNLEKEVEAKKSKKSLSPDAIIKIRSISFEITNEFDKRKKLYKNFKGFLSEHMDLKKLIDKLGLDEP